MEIEVHLAFTASDREKKGQKSATGELARIGPQRPQSKSKNAVQPGKGVGNSAA